MAGIIKSGHWQGGASSSTPVNFSFEDISVQADNYLLTIRRQAAQILAEAKQQAQAHVQAIEQEARERGRQAALQQAEQNSQAKLELRLQTLVPAMEKAVVAVQQSRESWLRNWEKNTTRLAIAIAERVIRHELTKEPRITLAWIREALELVMGEGHIALHLHPQDHAALGERTGVLTESISKLGRVELVADASIELGGCRVLTEFGSVDQQVSAQLARIEEELTA